MSAYRIVAVDVPGRAVRQLVRTDGTPLGTPRIPAPAPVSDGLSAGPPAGPPTPLRTALPWYVPSPATLRPRPAPRPGPSPQPIADDANVPNGEALRARREALGLSQRDLAFVVGCSRGLVAEVEGGRQRCTVAGRHAIAATLTRLEAAKAARPPGPAGARLWGRLEERHAADTEELAARRAGRGPRATWSR